jgi:hypothetical protein
LGIQKVEEYSSFEEGKDGAYERASVWQKFIGAAKVYLQACQKVGADRCCLSIFLEIIYSCEDL